MGLNGMNLDGSEMGLGMDLDLSLTIWTIFLISPNMFSSELDTALQCSHVYKWNKWHINIKYTIRKQLKSSRLSSREKLEVMKVCILFSCSAACFKL